MTSEFKSTLGFDPVQLIGRFQAKGLITFQAKLINVQHRKGQREHAWKHPKTNRERIVELREQGMEWNAVAALTGIKSNTCRSIYAGIKKAKT